MFFCTLCSNEKKECTLFLARTYVGKTSLNLWACSNGLKYISDDCALIDKDLMLQPLYTPIKIRKGVLWNNQFVNSYIFYQNETLKYVSLPFNNNRFCVKNIIFIERNHNKENVLEKVNVTDSIKNMFIHAYKIDDFVLHSVIIKKLVETSNCYKLMYDELNDDLYKLIKDVIT